VLGERGHRALRTQIQLLNLPSWDGMHGEAWACKSCCSHPKLWPRQVLRARRSGCPHSNTVGWGPRAFANGGPSADRLRASPCVHNERHSICYTLNDEEDGSPGPIDTSAKRQPQRSGQEEMTEACTNTTGVTRATVIYKGLLLYCVS
jgi:hypothetical protein